MIKTDKLYKEMHPLSEPEICEVCGSEMLGEDCTCLVCREMEIDRAWDEYKDKEALKDLEHD